MAERESAELLNLTVSTCFLTTHFTPYFIVFLSAYQSDRVLTYPLMSTILVGHMMGQGDGRKTERENCRDRH